jgi:hypothetical protein
LKSKERFASCCDLVTVPADMPVHNVMDLPQEVLEAIASHLPTAALLPLSLVCFRWQCAAELELYRDTAFDCSKPKRLADQLSGLRVSSRRMAIKRASVRPPSTGSHHSVAAAIAPVMTM